MASNYSLEFKQAAVRKMLNRGSKRVEDLAEEMGASRAMLYKWRDEFANQSGMKKLSRPKDRAATEKMKLLSEYSNLDQALRGEFLRKHGLHQEHIDEWKQTVESALSPKKKKSVESQDLKEQKKKVALLEKEIRRKDSALAEASALLILKKKADLIWGSGEDE